MALKQTRRSISIRGTTYDKLRQYCQVQDRSMSDIVEELLATVLDKDAPVAVKAAPASVAPAQRDQRDQKDKTPARLRFNPPPVMKPRPTLANRVVRAVAPSPPQRPVASNKPVLPGRPAPTPASAVSGTRRVEESTDDYRAIRF
jgi:hypothetical protein